MGQAAMQPGKLEDQIPEVVTEEWARAFCGKCFDEADWCQMAAGTPSVGKEAFLTCCKIRNHAPSLRSWLECWRIDELTGDLEDLEVMCADDLVDMDDKVMHVFYDGLKIVQKAHWEKARAHGAYLKTKPLGYMPWRPAGLDMWLDSWRLIRIKPMLFKLGVDCKEDILDFPESYWPGLELRLLEEKRWVQAVTNLKNLIKSFNFLSQRKSSVVSYDTFLKSLKLERLRPTLEAFGAFDVMDLDDLSDQQMNELQLTKLQKKHWGFGMNQIKSAKREAMADGKADLPSFRGCLESWRLLRIYEPLLLLGAVSQQDLLDLEPSEYGLLKMRPLEAKRFDQMLVALEEEFDAPYEGVPDDLMTRRQWQKKHAAEHEASLKKSAVSPSSSVNGESMRKSRR